VRGRRRSLEAGAPSDLYARPRGNFPQQWDEISQAELEHRHRQAQLLVARGHGAITWQELLGER
jgi:hypothetical protein